MLEKNRRCEACVHLRTQITRYTSHHVIIITISIATRLVPVGCCGPSTPRPYLPRVHREIHIYLRDRKAYNSITVRGTVKRAHISMLINYPNYVRTLHMLDILTRNDATDISPEARHQS